MPQRGCSDQREPVRDGPPERAWKRWARAPPQAPPNWRGQQQPGEEEAQVTSPQAPHEASREQGVVREGPRWQPLPRLPSAPGEWVHPKPDG